MGLNWRERIKKFTGNPWKWPNLESEGVPRYEQLQAPVARGLDIIIGHEGYKDIVRRALKIGDSINILFVGKPASGKSLFLDAIREEVAGDCLYFDGANTTNRILTDMEARRPQVVLIDEFEKMKRNYKETLLNFAESGRIKVAQQNRQYDFTIPGVKIFATANDLERITKPMESRFRILRVPEYTEEQFVEIGRRMLAARPLPQDIVEYIAKGVYERKGDIRQIRDIGKLVMMDDTPESVQAMLDTLNQGDNSDAS